MVMTIYGKYKVRRPASHTIARW